MIKPYRLINSDELLEIAQFFEGELNGWNSTYSLIPLTMALTLPPKNYLTNEGFIINDKVELLASVDKNYIQVMNQVLFGVDKSCFNAASQELFLTLINQLFKINQCSLHNAPSTTQDWFYRGSTSLLLTLSSNTNQMIIALSPAWVYRKLNRPYSIRNKPVSLDEAVAEQKLSLNIELYPVTLPLNQLVTLSPGDVIATDHPITSPCRLTQAEQLIAHAELGKSSPYKSIVLKRSS